MKEIAVEMFFLNVRNKESRSFRKAKDFLKNRRRTVKKEFKKKLIKQSFHLNMQEVFESSVTNKRSQLPK